MKILFENARILTSPYAPIIEGAVEVENDKIVKVGKKDENFKADIVKNCNRNLLMSGFSNAHAHSAMTLFRNLADDYPLQTWLFEKIFPLEAKLTAEDVYYGTMLAIAEYAKNGITAVGDMYFFDDEIVRAFSKSNIALALMSGKNDIGGNTEEALSYMEETYLKYANKNRLTYFLGLHAEYTCSEQMIIKTADLAQKYSAPTVCHLSETLKEVGDCTVKYKLTPPELFYKVGFFDNGGVVAHAVHLDKDDVKILSEKGIYVASCPSSNLKLSSGVAPVYTMLKNGINVCLGTDGASSNNALSMFREMYLLSVLQKEKMRDCSVLSAEEALSAATEKGYSALGFNGGRIEKGADADMVLIDLNAPNMQPISDIKKSLVYSAGDSNVLMTVAGGKIIYDNGKFDIGEDIDYIYKKAGVCIQNLVKRANG